MIGLDFFLGRECRQELRSIQPMWKERQGQNADVFWVSFSPFCYSGVRQVLVANREEHILATPDWDWTEGNRKQLVQSRALENPFGAQTGLSCYSGNPGLRFDQATRRSWFGFVAVPFETTYGRHAPNVQVTNLHKDASCNDCALGGC